VEAIWRAVKVEALKAVVGMQDEDGIHEGGPRLVRNLALQGVEKIGGKV